MTLVKVIDSTTWAGLTELDISESDDLSAALANGTYRLIHSATTALVVAAVSLVSGAPASISMTAYPATVTTPSPALTVTSASPAAITLTKYAATVSVSGGAPTAPDDNFEDGSIAGFWTQSVPTTNYDDLSFSEGSGAVTLAVGDTYGHDPYGSTFPIPVPLLVQDISIGTGDFEIVTQWSSEPTEAIQGIGIYLEDADGDWQRHDVTYQSGVLKGFVATWTGSTMQNKLAVTTVSHWAYLRVSRVSGTTHFYVSSNGTDWTEVLSGFSDARSWTKAGIYGMRTSSAAAFNAVCLDFAFT